MFFIFFSLKLSVSVTNNKYVGTLETGFGKHKNNTYLGFTVLKFESIHVVTSSAYVLPKNFLEHANIYMAFVYKNCSGSTSLALDTVFFANLGLVGMLTLFL